LGKKGKPTIQVVCNEVVAEVVEDRCALTQQGRRALERDPTKMSVADLGNRQFGKVTAAGDATVS
jgi:hypothetical protein